MNLVILPSIFFLFFFSESQESPFSLYQGMLHLAGKSSAQHRCRRNLCTFPSSSCEHKSALEKYNLSLKVPIFQGNHS